MKKPIFSNDSESVDDISENGDSFWLWKFVPFLQQIFEISLVAEFGDDITIILGTVDVEALHNILMIEFFESIDFPLKHLLFGSIANGSEIDNFDGDLFSGSFIDASKDGGSEAFAYEIVEAIGIILDFFANLIVAGCESHSNCLVIFLRFININCSIFK